MNGTSFLIDTIVNDLFLVSTLIDNGCECLAAVSDSLMRKANLPRMKVSTRKLTEATSNNKENYDLITEMTKMDLDIDGYKKTVYAYIIPRLSHELILGKPWMEQEDVVYHAKEHSMSIREAIVDGKPLRVWEKGYSKKNLQTTNSLASITSLSAGLFVLTLKKARKYPSSKKKTQLFSVTLADIQKSLAPKNRSGTSLEKLPQKYTEFSDLFRQEHTDKLPPHRLG